MGLQWLLLAQAIRLHPNGSLDTAGMFRLVTVARERLTLAFTLVAKLKFDPVLASQKTTFTLRIVNI